MADTFWREPINHSDSNVYHDYVMMQLRCGGRGALTAELYNNGGALNLSAGYIGIDDGVTKGTIERTAAGAISFAAITNSHWAKVEATVSGAIVTYTVTEMADADQWTIPATVKAAYNYLKVGYYIDADKRLIGIIYKTSGGTLGRIVNCESNRIGFKNISIIENNTAGTITLKYIAKIQFDIGDWNMHSTSIKQVAHGGIVSKMLSVSVWIRNDADNEVFPLVFNLVHPVGGATYIGGLVSLDSTNISMLRTEAAADGLFDRVDFDLTPFNRGIIKIDYET
jgi:hypothetical protein